jgi:hypothetical protein
MEFASERVMFCHQPGQVLTICKYRRTVNYLDRAVNHPSGGTYQPSAPFGGTSRGRLTVPNRLPVVDGLLAATALVRGWTLVTRDTADVQVTGVRLLNPFDDQVSKR